MRAGVGLLVAVVAIVWVASIDDQVIDLPGGSDDDATVDGRGTGGALGDEDADDVDLPDEIPEEGGSDGGGDNDGPGGGDVAAEELPEPSFVCYLHDCGWRLDVTHLGDVSTARAVAVDDELVVLPGTEGVAAVALDGTLRWDIVEHGGDAADVEVAADDGVVLVAQGGQLQARVPDTGERWWSVDVPGGAWLRPEARLTDDGTVVALFGIVEPADDPTDVDPAQDQVVRGHDRDDGEVRWEERSTRIELGASTAVLVDDELRGIDADTGEQRWTSDVAASLGDDEAEPAPPEGDDLHLAFAGPDRVLVHRWGAEEAVLLDAATGDEVVRAEGQPAWVRPAGDGSSGAVLVLAERGETSTLRAIDADGDTVWERSEVSADECCEDADDEDGAFLTWQAATGEELLLAPDDGSVVADWGEPEEGVTRIPAGLDAWVAHDGEDRSVTAVHAASGAELWRTVDGEPNPVLPELWLMAFDDVVLGIPADLASD